MYKQKVITLTKEIPLPYKNIEKQKESQHLYYVKNKDRIQAKNIEKNTIRKTKIKKWYDELVIKCICVKCGERNYRLRDQYAIVDMAWMQNIKHFNDYVKISLMNYFRKLT